MMKLYVVLLVAIVMESFGNVYITKGMKQLGEVQITSFSSISSTIVRAVKNPPLLAGVAFLCVFFGLFLAMLSWADITVVLPLTSFGYISTALIARWMLHEQINGWRWFGTLLICVGVYFITKSTPAHSDNQTASSKAVTTTPA